MHLLEVVDSTILFVESSLNPGHFESAELACWVLGGQFLKGFESLAIAMEVVKS